MLRRSLLVFIAFIVILSCSEEFVPDPFHPRNEHEAYLHALSQTGLSNTALGQDWQQVSQHVLRNPIKIEPPYEEAFYFDPGKADGIGYRFNAKRGQKIEIVINKSKRDSAKLFIDLFRPYGELEEYYEHVATADPVEHKIGFEPRQDAEYIVRVQPELLRGGELKIMIKKVPALSFPVARGNNRDIGSFFGDPRDGGRRKHHGIDIFAKRHTPIIAPVDGHVRFVGTRGLGGKVIWLHDRRRGMQLYFAHLQDWKVGSDTYVTQGDTLGTVGNTGNAKRTPPHLHFGIYKNGPIDPYHFVAKTKDKFSPIKGDSEFLGKYARTTKKTAIRDPKPEGRGFKNEKKNLERHQLVKVLGTIDDLYRIVLPDGDVGYVDIEHLEIASEPVRHKTFDAEFALFDAPTSRPLSIASCAAGENVELLGKNDAYWFVRNASGVMGWMLSP